MTISLTTCPSNLKEAIDWILRVTGKDGQDSSNGQQAIQTLTQKVKDLLKDVKDVLPGFNKEDFEKVTKTLDGSGASSGLIGKLADGLQQFIGYDPLGGTVQINTAKVGKTTGGGILPANVARHQVCNAVLNFVIRFLEGLCEIKGVVDTNKSKVLEVISTLRMCVGTGKVPQGFQQLVDGIKGKVNDLNGMQANVNKDLKHVFDKLKTVVTTAKLDSGGSKSVQSSNVESFLVDVFGKVKGETSAGSFAQFTKLCTQLAKLFEDSNIKSGKLSLISPLELKSTLQQHFNGAKNATTSNALTLEIDKLRNGKPVKRPNAATVVSAVRDATHAVVGDLQHKAYTSAYKSTSTWDSTVRNYVGDMIYPEKGVKCAKIFLSCLPLYYHALTYLYWRCDKGGWGTVSLGGGANNTYTLREFMGSMAFADGILNAGKNGTALVGGALSKFTEFQEAMSKAPSTCAYATFTQKLREEVSSQSGYTGYPLSALFKCASYYFRCQQIKSAKPTAKSPFTIREMLYFLAVLPYTAVYDELEEHITTSLSTPLPVAVSGSATKNETLSSSDLIGILVASSLSSPWVLGTIEGRGTSEPLLHDLYCNGMGFAYPSGRKILNDIADYAYALQFQLSFLYQQCSGTYSKACGWNQCTFGSNVKMDGVMSHICPTGCTNTGGAPSHDHTKNDCQHDNCGTKDKGSPLQAFLSDKLTGFSCDHPLDPSSHLQTCSGSLCHVPMGFTNHLRAGNNYQGSHISLTLKPLCGSCNTPLRQLSEKLGCLTKRTPRTLGDVFGFLWHLNDQMFRNTRPKMQELAKKLVNALGAKPPRNIPTFLYAIINDKAKSPPRPSPGSPSPIGLSRSLEAMAPAIPFLYQLFMAKDPKTLPGALFDLTKHCHKWDQNGQLKHQSHSSEDGCSTIDDLWGIYQGLTATSRQNKDIYEDCRKANCGGYLYPLTHTFGSTFAPKHASSYLSWFIHLTDDLEAGLREILERFKGLSCTNCKINCHSDFTGSGSCKCLSLLECADILPLIYEYGFSFNNAYYLKGVKYERNSFQPDPQNNRTCRKFSTQLSNVLASTSDTPLLKLLLTIDDFLYLFRFYFCYNLSAIWTLYLCIIIYTLFFMLDTLHLRSHLRFSSSHILSPIALLTGGKGQALTKLTYFVP
ncbi:variant erythrocyte surface antigen-1 family protein [Babesia caballi]|uniref:Variant erythrocyte surface antigen-1 family protein n=1 Tax=Babesia caballi TaxID=5871 RepID=A0AAV4M195_BABCB|nr:variant erythrocyte surface antigen-1 family protein [Babesia caballi]